MDKALKKERAAAKGLLTRACNSFIRAVDNHHDKAIVQERFSSVKERWNQVQLKHKMYKNLLEETTLAAEDTDEAEHETIRNQKEEWICQVEEEFENIECISVQYIQKAMEQPNAANLDQSTKEKQKCTP